LPLHPKKYSTTTTISKQYSQVPLRRRSYSHTLNISPFFSDISTDFRPIPYDENADEDKDDSDVDDSNNLNHLDKGKKKTIIEMHASNINSYNIQNNNPQISYNGKEIEEIYETIKEDIEEDISIDTIGLRTLKSFALSIFSFFVIFVSVFSISYLLFPGSFRLTNSIAGCQNTYCSYMLEPEYSESGGVVFTEDDNLFPAAKRLVYISPPRYPSNTEGHLF